MDDLIAFLRARLDETEAEAPDTHLAACGYDTLEFLMSCKCGVPVRVLADVASKRRIIDDVVPDVRGLEDRIDGEWGCGSSAGYEESETLLWLLALPFSDHPEYRKEWTP